MTQLIEAIIFDWGGVLIDDPRHELLRYCAAAFGVSQDEYTPVHDSFLDEFQRGLISERVFWERLAERLNKPKPDVPSLWTDAFRSAYVPRAEVFALASKLHDRGYRTALLSNTEAPAMEFLRGLGYDMFDVQVFSCAEGLVKPERKVYEITLDRLGVGASRTVLIDDRKDFVEAAQQAGLNTIIFDNFKHLRDRLALLGVRTD